ncbi:MAG: aspartate aminotransferase family protein [Clostridia bacterium]|nr:aspartate aminotransferase family protein [Clostridia bacterium]
MDQTYVANTYGRFQVPLAQGEGAVWTDEGGKEYIDLGSGIAVNTFGACDPIWAQAVEKQLHTLSHASNLYYTSPQANLARLLCEKTGMAKVFFGNSGAEANECMIKVARKYASDKYGPGHSVVVTLQNSFHGRTIATLAATGQDVFHQHFGPFPGDFVHVPANDLEALKAVMEKGCVCGVMLEMVQGEGGVMPLDKAYVQGVRKLCDAYDALMLVDEVQTGNGRTGSLYAYMQFDIVPDVFSTAKGLGGGLPIGACVMSEKAAHVLGAGDHGSTFGGNPICAAGALSILERLDDSLMAEVKAKGDYIVKSLEGAPGVKSVSGLGLMLGIETEKPARQVVTQCLEKGVTALTAKAKVRLLPPLSITWEQLEKAIAVLKECLAP